jgi:hypothetical protein
MSFILNKHEQKLTSYTDDKFNDNPSSSFREEIYGRKDGRFGSILNN